MLMVSKESLSPQKMKNPNFRGINHCPESHSPGEGQVLRSLPLTPEQIIKVICFLIPTKLDQQFSLFHCLILLSIEPHGEVRILNLTSYSRGKKKILENREEREQKSKMGVVGGIQQ